MRMCGSLEQEGRGAALNSVDLSEEGCGLGLEITEEQSPVMHGCVDGF